MKNIIKITALLLLLTVKSFSQSEGWQISGFMPKGISGAEAVVVDSLIYVFGGYSDSVQRITDWIYAFDPARNTWTYKNKMKKRRNTLTANKVGNYIYYSGGEVDNLFKANGTVEVYDILNNTVSVFDSSKKFNRIRGTGLAEDSILYIAGGDLYNPPPTGTNPFVFEYRIPTKTMTYNSFNYFIGRFPEEQMISSVGNHIYIMGGYFNTVSRDIFRYNKSKHWLTKIPFGLLTPRSAGEAIKIKDSMQVMVIGGYNEGNRSLNTVELYDFKDTTSIKTRSVPYLSYKRKYFMTAFVKGYIYVFGGLSDNDQHVLAIERFELVTDIQEEQSLKMPDKYELFQNYPNPFNGSTTINYTLPERGYIIIKVYDILGKEVTELINKEETPGNHSITFDSSRLSSGIYYYRLITKSNSITKKMILLK